MQTPINTYVLTLPPTITEQDTIRVFNRPDDAQANWDWHVHNFEGNNPDFAFAQWDGEQHKVLYMQEGAAEPVAVMNMRQMPIGAHVPPFFRERFAAAYAADVISAIIRNPNLRDAALRVFMGGE